MDEKSISTAPANARWFIDLDWYQRNNRSLFALAYNSLCSKCRDRVEEKETSAAELLHSIKDCCSRTSGFVTRQLPVLESVFRLFLANGNQPLSLEELGKQLREWREGDTHATLPETLSRLLESDQYYGFRRVEDQPEAPSVTPGR